MGKYAESRFCGKRNDNLKNVEIVMEREIAKGLLSIGAVFLRPEQPFTWASGIKSPIYCDNRLILTAPEVRKKVEAAIAETVKAKFPACGSKARRRASQVFCPCRLRCIWPGWR